MNTKASIKDLRTTKVSDDLKRISKELSKLSLVADQTEEKEMFSIDDLADVLKNRRKELGFANQEEAAAISSVSLVTYRKTEDVKGNPTIKTLKAIAEGLNLKIWIEKC
jgi:DNA-binding XRE family transcriptional regulator